MIKESKSVRHLTTTLFNNLCLKDIHFLLLKIFFFRQILKKKTKMALHLRSSPSLKSTFLNILRQNLGFGSRSHVTRHIRQNLPHDPPLRGSQNPIRRFCNTMAEPETLSSFGQHEDARNHQVHALLPIPITPRFHFETLFE